MHPIYWIKDIGVVVVFPERAVTAGPGSNEKNWFVLTASDENGLDETLIGLRAVRAAQGAIALVGLLPNNLAGAGGAIRVSVSRFTGFSVTEAKTEIILLADMAPLDIVKGDVARAHEVWLKSGYRGAQSRFLTGPESDKKSDGRVGFSEICTREEEPCFVVAPFSLDVSSVDVSTVFLNGSLSDGVLKFTGIMRSQQAARLRLIVVPRRSLSSEEGPLEMNMESLACSMFSADIDLDDTYSSGAFFASASVKPRDYVILTSIADELTLEVNLRTESFGLQRLIDESDDQKKPATTVFEIGLGLLQNAPFADNGELKSAHSSVETSPKALPSPHIVITKAADDFAFKAVFEFARSEAFDSYLRMELAKCAEVYLPLKNVGRVGLSFARGISWSNDNHALLAPLLAAADSLGKDIAQQIVGKQVRPDLPFLMDQHMAPELEFHFTLALNRRNAEFSEILFQTLWPNNDLKRQSLSKVDITLLTISLLEIDGFRRLVRSWNLSLGSAVDLAQSWSKKTPEKFEQLSSALLLFSSLFPSFQETENILVSLVKWYESPRRIAEASPRLSFIYSSSPIDLTIDDAEDMLQAARLLGSLSTPTIACSGSDFGRLRAIINLPIRRTYYGARKNQAQVSWPELFGGLGVAFEAANAALSTPGVGPSQPLQQQGGDVQNEQ